MNESIDEESVMIFPCEFPFKVMGLNTPTFESEMVMITRKHVSNLGEGAVRSNPSKNGKYIAVTITFIAHSREQLDNLYREATAHPDVRMVL